MADILDFGSERFWLFSTYKSTRCFLPSFESFGFFSLGEEAKNRFSFPSVMILAIFDLQIITMLPTKFRVNRPFMSEEEAKNRFSRWPPWRPSWISDREDFSYF